MILRLLMSQDQDIFYDVDRDIIGPHRSPPLVAVKPNFESEDSPPPLVRIDPSSDSTDVEDTDGVRPRKPKRRKGQTKPTFADGVLIRSLDPSQELLARQAESTALESASQSEADEEDNEAVPPPGREQMRRSNHVVRNGATQASTQSKTIAEAALSAISESHDNGDDWPMIDTPVTGAEEILSRSPPRAPSKNNKSDYAEQAPTSLQPKPPDLPKKQFDTRPPPLGEGKLRVHVKPSQASEEDEEDSIVKSPAIGKFAITPRNAPADIILPAMHQRSPPRSSPAGSPDHRQTLPNIKTAIGNIHDTSLAGFASMSPIIGRPLSAHIASFASPASYSAMSPPGPPSHYNWRTTTRDSNNSTSSEYTSSSAPTSTPASSIVMASPAASNPSSLTAVPEQDRDNNRRDSTKDFGPDSRSESPEEPDPEDALDSAPFASGSYKCTYQGCTAAPFQTQYLLNSHMNVHSNTRTHFCPVKSCPRGPGGQGFKRKNEMIRCVKFRISKCL